MPQLDGSVFVSGSYTYAFIIFLVISMILSGELIILKHTFLVKNFYSFKKLNLIKPLIYKKFY